MLTPPYLKKGDRVGIVCTARKVDLDDLEKGIIYLKKIGLVPVLGKTIGASADQYGGTDSERAADLQTMRILKQYGAQKEGTAPFELLTTSIFTNL